MKIQAILDPNPYHGVIIHVENPACVVVVIPCATMTSDETVRALASEITAHLQSLSEKDISV